MHRKDKLKQRMMSKLNESTSWSYIPVYLPPNVTKPDLIKGMQIFIDQHLDVAIEKSTAVLPHFSDADCASIGTPQQTENVMKFFDLLNFLEQHGFPGPATFAKPINFYTGVVAQKRAYYSNTELSLIERMIPAFTVLYDLWYAVQEKPRSELIFWTLSRILATFAKGTVNVYLSSNNPTQLAGFVVGSYFWDIELPILQHSHALSVSHPNHVSAIMIHCYDAALRKWHAPINFYSEQSASIPVYVKEAEDRYKMSDGAQLESFKMIVSLGRLRQLNFFATRLLPVLLMPPESDKQSFVLAKK